MSDQSKLPIIGRERALIEAFTNALAEAIGGPAPSKRILAQLRRHRSSKPWKTDRGMAFEVQVHGPEGGATGHICRVTVELDRFEFPNKEGAA